MLGNRSPWLGQVRLVQRPWLGQPIDTSNPPPPPQPVIQCKSGNCPSAFCLTIGPVSTPDLKKVSDMLQATQPGKFWIYPKTAIGPGDQDYVVWCNAYSTPVPGAVVWNPPAGLLSQVGCKLIGFQVGSQPDPEIQALVDQAKASGLQVLDVRSGRPRSSFAPPGSITTADMVPGTEFWSCPGSPEGSGTPATQPGPTGSPSATASATAAPSSGTALAVGGGLAAAGLLAFLAFR